MPKNPHNLSEAIRRLDSAANGDGHSKTGDDFATLKNAFETLKNDFFKTSSDTLNQGKEKAQELGQTVDKQIHEHPWWAIGAVGLVAFLIGFLLGRKD